MPRLAVVVCSLFVGLGSVRAAAQDLPPPSVHADCSVQLPAGFDAARPTPLLVLFDADAAALAIEIARAGFIVARPASPPESLGPNAFDGLRAAFVIDQGAMHAAASGDHVAGAVPAVLRNRHQFQTLTVWGGAAAADVAAVQKLHARRVHVLGEVDGASLREHFRTLHAERRQAGAAAAVDAALDAFHEAAAKGDEARYFHLLPDDAVFLGTDASERWTGAEFRRFAMPYFERPSAWVYVPLQRHVEVADGGELAWFDEVLDNDAYGECRGSGVLVRRGGGWVLRQYNLTVPVPNELARGLSQRIRAFVDGGATTATAVTTVILVRHAEKGGEGLDPGLVEAGERRAARLATLLRDVPLTAIYATEYRRTAATVAPTGQAHALATTTLPAHEVRPLAAALREREGETVLVCGHSNTVPAVLRALGVTSPPAIDDAEYDRLFVVTIDAEGARLLALRY